MFMLYNNETPLLLYLINYKIKIITPFSYVLLKTYYMGIFHDVDQHDLLFLFLFLFFFIKELFHTNIKILINVLINQ